MLVDCMWSFGWRLEGVGEDHKVCNLFELAIIAIVVSNHVRSQRLKLMLTYRASDIEIYANMWGRRGSCRCDSCVDNLSVGTCQAGGCLTCRSEGPIVVDRVSPVR